MSELHSEEASKEMRERLAKRERLIAEGIEPYPAEVPVTHTISQVREAYEGKIEPGVELEDEVAVAGRIMLRRGSGKIAFTALQEGSGTRIQAIFQVERTSRRNPS